MGAYKFYHDGASRKHGGGLHITVPKKGSRESEEPASTLTCSEDCTVCCTAVVMVGTKKRGLLADNNLPHWSDHGCSGSATSNIEIYRHSTN